MAVGVACFSFGGIAEQARNFGVSLDIGEAGEIEVAPVGLGFTGEGCFQVLMRVGAF